MVEKFINSDSQPTGPDAVLNTDHILADGILSIVGPCPPRILAAGPEFRVKIGHTICKVTSLGVGNILWAVSIVEDTVDDTYETGTPIYLEYTAGSIYDAIFGKPFVFASSEIAQYPNSSVVPTSIAELTTDVDTVTTPPTVDQALLFDGTKWKPGDVVAGATPAAGHYEVIMSGTGPPPDPITTPDGLDWIYGFVPD